MLAIIGTVPDEAFPLTTGQMTLKGETLFIQGRPMSVNRGTPALAAAAIEAGQALGLPAPTGFLKGDVGLGRGSRELYRFLVERLPRCSFKVLTFHYLQPDVDWHNKVLFSVEEMKPRPILVADAGFMYAAKMSGQAGAYDLFTPDAGELAFLADEEAPHPFYTRGFILHENDRIPELIERAFAHQNAARLLLVKGSKDFVADKNGLQATVIDHAQEAMEAIGGTGDTLTGIASALIASGLDVAEAARAAAAVNRLAGHYAEPTPATQVIEIIHNIRRAAVEVLALKPPKKG